MKKGENNMRNLLLRVFVATMLFMLGCQTSKEESVLNIDPSAENVIPFVGPTLQADINGDGIVDVNDTKIMASEWGKEQTNDDGWRSDFNNDGIVDLKDLAVMVEHWLGEK